LKRLAHEIEHGAVFLVVVGFKLGASAIAVG
jgi:hypothetical protein